MGFWRRLLITFIVMFVASLVVGLVWRGVFDAGMPSYLSGVVGGLAALATWELLKPGQRRG